MSKIISSKILLIFMSILLSLTVFSNAFAASFSDISGHWAEETLKNWNNKGLIEGYPDGTLKPNQPISRVEWVVLVNKAFHLKGERSNTFKDVNKDDWFYNDIQKALASDYITGYEDGSFLPNKHISRQELAVVISRLLKLSFSNAAENYADTKNSAEWSKGSIGAVIDHKIMDGYSAQRFGPLRDATRAEAIVILDRAAAYQAVHPAVVKTFNESGTYGPETGTETVQGDVTISAPGVTLKNTTITGNLTLAEGIGEGDVFLNHINVQGLVSVKAGGSNSVHFIDSSFNQVTVNKQIGKVRVVIEGTTTVKQVTLQSTDALLELGKDTKVLDLVVNASAKITGEGKIGKATIASNGVSIEPKPAEVQIGSGVTAMVGGEQMKSQEPAAVIGSGGGGGAGGSNGPGTPGAALPAGITPDAFFPTTKAVKWGATVELSTAPAEGVHAWFAPSGTTAFTESGSMTHLSGNGTNKKIQAPSNEGSYYLFLVGGNQQVSVQSKAVLQVRKTQPTGQDTVFSNDQSAKPGAPVTLNATPASGLTAWFAPDGTTQFAEGADMTQFTSTTIKAPALERNYRLYLVDALGIGSPASTKALTVDGTAPTTQDQVFANGQAVNGSVSVTLNQAPAEGEKVWFAAVGTTTFISGDTITSIDGNGSLKQIPAPKVQGDYRLFVQDKAGNISKPSAQVLRVDNTPPANQDEVFKVSVSSSPELDVLLSLPLGSGVTAWFAPAVTELKASAFSETDPNMSKSNASGAIKAPKTKASYKLFLIDDAKNVSAPSKATLTVN